MIFILKKNHVFEYLKLCIVGITLADAPQTLKYRNMKLKAI